ncbi:unnamed protein product [Bursaphelenchus okinawaensis]|uniref:Superoxide dismutase [Cu-Zn] n=1 Tax=Bursaphelenchus okinawaensis TaxID=465554 RepID=A0A811L625_9BILA|nr:unnamed protein product [Bursaphelenchus okinawaensis]CAG9120074.1 unnamed protein product [Bursaphelenchus okinawaensis]
MKSLVFALLLLNLFTEAENLSASVDIHKAGDKEPGEKIGTLELTQDGDKLKITGKLTGLPQGKHGFHVHEKSDLTNKCLNTGGHFNPFKKNHGAPTDTERHVGDFGNLDVGADGTVTLNFEDHLASLQGETNVLNHAVVIHEKADDLGKGGDEGSLKTGNAGARIACGLIASGTGSVIVSLGLIGLFLTMYKL